METLPPLMEALAAARSDADEVERALFEHAARGGRAPATRPRPPAAPILPSTTTGRR